MFDSNSVVDNWFLIRAVAMQMVVWRIAHYLRTQVCLLAFHLSYILFIIIKVVNFLVVDPIFTHFHIHGQISSLQFGSDCTTNRCYFWLGKRYFAVAYRTRYVEHLESDFYRLPFLFSWIVSNKYYCGVMLCLAGGIPIRFHFGSVLIQAHFVF